MLKTADKKMLFHLMFLSGITDKNTVNDIYV